MMKRMRNLFRSHEDNLARLTARRDDLARRLAEAEAGFDRITAERRRLLIDADDPDGPALERAERDWLTAHGRFAALQDAHREIVERIAAAQETLAAEQDRAERTRAAQDLDARAAAIDAAAASLSDTLEGVAVAHGALVDAIRAGGLPAGPDMARRPGGERRRYPARGRGAHRPRPDGPCGADRDCPGGRERERPPPSVRPAAHPGRGDPQR